MNRDRLIVVLLCVAAILVVAIVGMSLATDRNREVAVAKLRAKGSAMGGRLPAGMAVVAHPKKDDTPKPSAAEPSKPSPSDAESLAAFQRLIEKKKALSDAASWKDVFDMYGKRPNEWTEAERARIAAFLAANRDLILDLRRLAESGGPLYRLDYSKGFGMELPHLAQLRDFARMLAADAAVSADAGNYAEAIDDLIAGMKLANGLDKEPFLISQLVHFAMAGVLLNAIEGSMRGEDLPADQCARLIQCLSNAANRQALADSFTTEGLFGLNAFEGIRTGETRNITYGTFGNNDWEPFLLGVYASPFARPWLNSDEETYADIMGRVGDAARLPYCEAKPILDQVDAEFANLPRTRVLSRLLLPSLSSVVFSASRYETLMNLTCIGLAVEQYHAQNGAYPSSLDAVAPTLGGVVPTDPLTGQPYVYQPSGGSFALYSAYTAPPPAEGSSAPQRVPGADANGHFSWRGPQ